MPDQPMPTIEIGDWVRGPFSGHPIEVTHPSEWTSPDTLARLTEIRKANGTIWRREDHP